MGTKLRHIKLKNLVEMEDLIESLPYKIEIKNINRVGQNWFVHFTVGDFAETRPLTKVLPKEK